MALSWPCYWRYIAKQKQTSPCSHGDDLNKTLKTSQNILYAFFLTEMKLLTYIIYSCTFTKYQRKVNHQNKQILFFTNNNYYFDFNPNWNFSYLQVIVWIVHITGKRLCPTANFSTPHIMMNNTTVTRQAAYVQFWGLQFWIDRYD